MQSYPIIPSSPAHAPLPLAVASISREQARLARQIGLGRQAALPALAPDALLTLQAASEPAPSWLEPLAMHGSFGRIELVRGARLLRALSGIDLGDDGHGPHWDWLQGAVCGRLAGTPLAGATGLERGGGAAPGQVTLRLTLRSAGHLIATHASASAADWLQLLAGGDWLRLQSPFDAYAALQLRMPLRLARHRLPHAMLAGLRAGDVLQPDSAAFDCHGEGSVTLGGLRATVRYQAPGSLIILALETPMEEAQDLAYQTPQEVPQAYGATGADVAPARPAGRSADAPAADATHAASASATMPAAALDQLPATLDFELGKLALSLGALRSLAVGSTLLLAGADPAALEIRCAGRLLGRGEAVDVEGRLGVRITEWSAA